VNLAFEGVVPSNQTTTALDFTVPEHESWRLTLLTIKHAEQHIAEHEELASPPGTLVARLALASNGEERTVYTFSGDSPFIREPLHSVLETGDRLIMEITARHHEHACAYEGYVSLERRNMTDEGALRVEVLNQPTYVTAPNYLHFQVPAAATWIISHMLGRYPNVTTVDSLGREIEGEITYLDPNTVRADFERAVGGSAFCS